MIRTLAFIALVGLLAGCTKNHTRAQGPFGHKKEPPPPYGAVGPSTALPKPPGNHSPLGIASADPAPIPPPADPALIPPSARGIAPAGGVEPDLDDPNAFPPFKRRPRPQPEPLPSPYAPKEPPAPAKADAKGLAPIKDLLTTANDVWKATDTYEATLTRRELNPKGEVNSEVLIFQFRREPMSVFTRNIGTAGKGRELVYYPAKHGDKLYVMLGQGDSKLVKAGFIAPPMSPDDSKVKEKARYSIRDAGFGRTLKVLGDAVAKVEAGKAPAESLAYHGEVKRDEYAHPLVGITHKLRRGDDPLMPTGGTRLYFFDMKNDSQSRGMPVLVIATDSAGKEVEYYLFEKVKSPAGLTDADFDPARLGKK